MIISQRKTSPANRGKSLELVVTASAGTLLELVKIPNGVRYLAGGVKVPTKSPVDYLGVIRATGRAICFDAKKCALVKSFPIGNRDHFPAHQREFLIRMGEAGAVSGLLVESAAIGRYLWLTWATIERERVASLTWDCGWWHDLGPNTHAIQFASIPAMIPSLLPVGRDAGGQG